MKTRKIKQVAFAGYFAVQNEKGLLVAGRPAFTGGVTIARPRLYTTPEAAREAADAMKMEPVLLVSGGK